MITNPYATGARTVVIHEDDVGMSHGANAAFQELSMMGACSSGSVMAPCPWFPEAVAMAKANPTLDLGVHLTLNSEKQPYRWRPLTSPPRSAGLTDEAGYFWSTVPGVRKHAAPEAVEAELRAQIDMTLAAGVDVTHLDAHMGAAMTPEFVDIYSRHRPRTMTRSSPEREKLAIRSSISSSKPPGAGRPTPRPRIARCSPIFLQD
jgi:predicted glycoside hydrolase/deacetylase ChbG (UPF0249 family)